ncbi:MAG: hypothetical protein PHS93_08500 [Candidatus Omnitrophica bacterium]|jgi:hypothetical protein|nr:hypothetical protein [Candidatus Neomarinimicrobiota bacterium]MDD5353183.1 hypothetical protein [Candidatus Omnitrophota bacterium]
MAKKKRKMTAAQKAALAKGRADLAKKRKQSGRKKTVKAKSVRPKTATTSKRVVAMAKKKKVVKKALKKGRRRGTRNYKEDATSVIKNSFIAAASGVGVSFLANKIPGQNRWVKPLVPITVGAGMLLAQGEKIDPMVASAALGMIAIGGLSIFRTMAPAVPLLAGESDYVVIPQGLSGRYIGPEMSGSYRSPTLSGNRSPATM